MSYAARLIHPLVLVRTPADPDALDEYGHATPGSVVRTEIQGLIQPKTAKEMADTREAGAETSTYTVFLLPTQIGVSDHLEDADGFRYDVDGVRRFDFGRSPHLEVDARRVGRRVIAEAGS